MSTVLGSANAKPGAPPFILAWPRVKVALVFGLLFGFLFSMGWKTSLIGLYERTIGISLIAVLVFGVFERWPKHLPGWLARWVLQVLTVGITMPVAMFFIYVATTPEGAVPFWHDKDRLAGYGGLAGISMLIAPWIVLFALVRQKDALARHQALTFELQRSELERQALDSRMRLLQAQVEPHFLFNTLANVRELVQAGSPQAPAVLESLIAYLRAAVPRLQDAANTLGQELDLVRSYLEVMHMRMPDRLQYSLHADDTALNVHCPPMTLLTLVENAVRHGVDPSEDGGRIEVRVRLRSGRVQAQVCDTGVGLRAKRDSLGTGLTTLRERLQLVFNGDAQVRLIALEPRGACAELDFPAR